MRNCNLYEVKSSRNLDIFRYAHAEWSMVTTIITNPCPVCVLSPCPGIVGSNVGNPDGNLFVWWRHMSVAAMWRWLTRSRHWGSGALQRNAVARVTHHITQMMSPDTGHPPHPHIRHEDTGQSTTDKQQTARHSACLLDAQVKLLIKQWQRRTFQCEWIVLNVP